MFVCVEGIDRSGKTTLCAALAKRLDAVHISFPDYSAPKTGTRLKQILSMKECPLSPADMHRLFAENRAECAAKLHKLLDDGKLVVADRYTLSGAAYSMANGLSPEWCLNQEKNLPSPDLIVYLDISPEEAATRQEYGTQYTERVDFQHKVRQAYMNLMLLNVYGNWCAFSSSGNNQTELLESVCRIIEYELGKVMA